MLQVHPTAYRYVGDADPSAPGGIAAIYRDLVSDRVRTVQVVDDVVLAIARGRHCLVLTQWKNHVEAIAEELRARGHDPTVLVGGMGAKARAAALDRLVPREGAPPLLAVATGPYVGIRLPTAARTPEKREGPYGENRRTFSNALTERPASAFVLESTKTV